MENGSKPINIAHPQTAQPALTGKALFAAEDVKKPSSTLNTVLARFLDIFLIAGPLVHLWLFIRVNGYFGIETALWLVFGISTGPFFILFIARILMVSVMGYVLLIFSAGSMTTLDLYMHFSSNGDGRGWALITIPLFIQFPFALFVLLITVVTRHVSRPA